jgi:hypothetical protein
MTFRSMFASLRESKLCDETEDLAEFKEDLETHDVDAEADNS